MKENGFDGTVKELRLLPYVISRLLDNKPLVAEHLNGDEFVILCNWVDKGWIVSEDFLKKLIVTDDFFNKMVKVLKLGYLEDVVIDK